MGNDGLDDWWAKALYVSLGELNSGFSKKDGLLREL